jgi:16S rRNA processing protein RimM
LIEEGELSVGILKAPFGLEGWLTLVSHSGEAAHFAGLSEIVLLKEGKRSPARIEEFRQGEKGLLVRLAGCHDAETARRLAGSEIIVPRAKAAPLGPGQYYATDLAGCALCLNGAKAALILSVIEGGIYDFLEAELPDGRRALVPFSKEFIGRVDLPGRSVDLLKEWILE